MNTDRTEKEWTEYAGEPVTIEVIGGTLYAFGSELAMLRLYKRFQGMGRAEYSMHLATWYYTNDKQIGV